MIHLTEEDLIVSITIPNYIRKVKLSDKRRAIYYFYDGVSVRARSKGLPAKYYRTQGYVFSVDNLKDEYKIIYTKGTNKKYIIENDEDLQQAVNEVKAKFDGKVWFADKLQASLRLHKFDDEFKQYLPVIANPDTVGTPNYLIINGQSIYSSNIAEFTRGEMFKQIKDSFLPYLVDIPPVIKYPILIDLELHDTVDNVLAKGSTRWDVDNRAYPYCKAFCDTLVDLKIIKDDDRLHITRPPAPTFYPTNGESKLVFNIYKDPRVFEDGDTTFNMLINFNKKSNKNGDTI